MGVCVLSAVSIAIRFKSLHILFNYSRWAKFFRDKMRKSLLLLFSFLALYGCTENQIDPELPVEAPRITDFGVLASDTTIALGAQIALQPKVTSNEKGLTYNWEVDSKSVAQTAAFTFSTKEAGVYALKYSVRNESGVDSRELTIRVKPYLGGFYIVNEGWFGHDPGSVSYFDPKTETLTLNVYKLNNGGMTLGTTTCYGALWEGRYYFISKQGRRVVVADALSMKDRGSLEVTGGDGRAFVGVNESSGVLTTGEGAYRLSLDPLVLGAAIEGTVGAQCGGVYATNNYLFVINQDEGIQIFSIANNYALVKTHPTGSVGFARSKDGSLWAADGGTLVKINPETLDIQEIALPSGVVINNSWGAWNAGSLCASPIENALFFTKAGMWGGGREIYRYVIGQIESLGTAFATSSVADDNFYGSGISVDPVSGDIVATFVKDGWGDSYSDNRLVVFDGRTGAEKSRTVFTGYWFPSMVLFNN